MKFSQVLLAFVAVAVQALPVEERSPEDSPVLVVSSQALDARDIQALDAREIEKRAANLQFTVYPGTDCSTGGTTIYASDAVTKDNFSPAQKSIRLNALNSGYHLSLYTASNQGGSLNLRLNAGNVGNCWYFTSGWLSYGLYTGS